MESRASFESESHEFFEHRQAMRTGVLTGLGEVIVVNLGSQTGLLLDIANSGLAVQAVYPVARNASIAVRFPLPFTGTSIGATCRVAWADYGGRAGLAFLRVADADRRQLDRWLAKYHEGNPCPHAAAAGKPVANDLVTASPQIGDTGNRQCAAGTSVAPHLKQSASTPTSSTLLSDAVTRARHLAAGDGAAIVLCGPEGAVCEASTGEAPDVGSRLHSESGFTAECLRTGNVVLCSDVDNDPRAQLATVKRLRLRSVLIVPIVAGSSVLGALEVLSTRQGAFESRHAAALQPLADMMAAALCVPDETSSGISGFKQAFAEAKKATASLLDQIRLRFSVAGVADWIRSLSFARAIFKLQQRTRSCLSRARAVVRPWYAYAGLACLGLALGALLLGVLWRNSASVSGVGGTKLLNEPANQPATVSNAEGHESSSVERRPRVRNQNGTDGLEGKSSSVARHEPPLPAGNSFGDATGADDTVIIRNSGLGSAGTPKPTSLQAIANAATVRNFLEKPIPLGALGNVPQPRDLLGVLSANPPPLPRLAPPSQRLRASEVIEGQAISLPLPLYPEEARRRGVQGSVFVRNVIDINGRIKHVAVLEGDPVLVQPAIDAVKQWRYAPTYLNRIPVETESIDELKFAVTDKAPEVSAPLHLPKDLKRGRLISQSMPVYPEAARRLRLDGTVVVQAIVGADGTIRQLRQVSGSHVLGQAALQALKKWRYEPSYMDGKPIEVNTTIVVNFKEH